MKFKYEIHAEVFPLKHDGDMDKANKILIYRTYGNIVSTYISYFYILNKLKKYINDKNFFVKLPSIHAHYEKW